MRKFVLLPLVAAFLALDVMGKVPEKRVSEVHNKILVTNQ
jgi:hypothetical protein